MGNQTNRPGSHASEKDNSQALLTFVPEDAQTTGCNDPVSEYASDTAAPNEQAEDTTRKRVQFAHLEALAEWVNAEAPASMVPDKVSDEGEHESDQEKIEDLVYQGESPQNLGIVPPHRRLVPLKSEIAQTQKEKTSFLETLTTPTRIEICTPLNDIIAIIAFVLLCSALFILAR